MLYDDVTSVLIYRIRNDYSEDYHKKVIKIKQTKRRVKGHEFNHKHVTIS